MSTKGIYGLLAFCIAFAMPLVAQAATPTVQNMKVVATLDDGDTVGSQYLYFLREDIRRSSSYRLVDGSQAAWKLIIVTVGYPKGKSSIYSAVLVLDEGPKGPDLYLTNFVGTCGMNSTESCAKSILGNTDQFIENFKARVNSRK